MMSSRGSTVKQQSRRHYDAEFKKDAVALANSEGRTIADAAESLGMKPTLLYH